MRPLATLLPRLIVFMFAAQLRAADASADMTPLFNGKDLSGWHPVNVHPSTFSVRDGLIISTGVPTGVMRSEKQYENFILEIEWKHMKEGGNAGLFVWADPLTAVGQPFTRAIEVQILDGRNSETYTSHGDLFSIHGAKLTPDRPHPKGWERCLPSEQRANPAGQWNHYRVTCNDGVLKLAVNGKEVSGGSKCWPRKGYLCLESEGSECHFRNIRIKELPSTNPKPEDVAPLAEDYHILFAGLDLDRFAATATHKDVWKPADWILDCTGQGDADARRLATKKNDYRDFVMICDYRIPEKNEPKDKPQPADAGYLLLRGAEQGIGRIALPRTAKPAKPAGQWNRATLTLKDGKLTMSLNDEKLLSDADASALPKSGPLALEHAGQAVQFGNLYVKELK